MCPSRLAACPLARRCVQIVSRIFFSFVAEKLFFDSVFTDAIVAHALTFTGLKSEQLIAPTVTQFFFSQRPQASPMLVRRKKQTYFPNANLGANNST